MEFVDWVTMKTAGFIVTFKFKGGEEISVYYWKATMEYRIKNGSLSFLEQAQPHIADRLSEILKVWEFLYRK